MSGSVVAEQTEMAQPSRYSSRTVFLSPAHTARSSVVLPNVRHSHVVHAPTEDPGSTDLEMPGTTNVNDFVSDPD